MAAAAAAAAVAEGMAPEPAAAAAPKRNGLSFGGDSVQTFKETAQERQTKQEAAAPALLLAEQIIAENAARKGAGGVEADGGGGGEAAAAAAGTPERPESFTMYLAPSLPAAAEQPGGPLQPSVGSDGSVGPSAELRSFYAPAFGWLEQMRAAREAKERRFHPNPCFSPAVQLLGATRFSNAAAVPGQALLPEPGQPEASGSVAMSLDLSNFQPPAGQARF